MKRPLGGRAPHQTLLCCLRKRTLSGLTFPRRRSLGRFAAPVALGMWLLCAAYLLLARNGEQPSRLTRMLTALAPPSASSSLARVVRGKRVVIVSHELTLTGAPFVCTELAQLLAEAGARVSVLVGPRGGEATDAELFEQAARMVPTPRFEVRYDGGAQRTVASAADADVVIVSTVVPEHSAWLVAFRAAYPHHRGLVQWVHEGPAFMDTLDSDTAAAAVRAIATPGVLDGVLFASNTTRQWWLAALRERAWPFDPVLPRVDRVVLWGVPRWRLTALAAAARDVRVRDSLRVSKDISHDDFVFLSLSTFQRVKGHAGMFKAFARAREMCAPRTLRLVAVGTQSEFPPGLEWVLSDTDIIIEGPTTEVAAYLTMADAYVSNTQGGGETWGLATLLALAAGKAVLASSAGATREQMTHNVSALVHTVSTDDFSGNAEMEELASHMCTLALRADVFDRLRNGGAAHVRDHFGPAHLDATLTSVFVDLLL